ncbi:hypothetical protein LZC95_07545 [Pendulispora brunnea]|uniref:DUF3102 domain-containing protein n=1 Tax=Pendulispora brunnea TaxID=2905690 RepID=A0ABZ2KDC0_9BACT
MRETKVVAQLAAAEANHADDPERVELLRRARRFKSSWVELAESLTRVRRTGQWKAWGYDSFENYARRELHLKPETVDKLTGSFAFLSASRPEVLARDGISTPIPNYQAVDFLRRAEAENVPSDTLESLRRRVLDEGAPLPALNREFRDQVFPVDEDTLHQREVAGLRNVATRLRQLLAETRTVPRKLASEVSTTLDHLLEVLEDREEEAA